jgi:hypothetical protein
MSSITTAGLAQQVRVLVAFCLRFLLRLSPRGVDEGRLTALQASAKMMTDQRGTTGTTRTGKKELTRSEGESRAAAIIAIQKIQQAAKNSFPTGSPFLEDFHINERLSPTSTTQVTEWGKDTLAGWEKHKVVLLTKGGLEADKMALETMLAELELRDTVQEMAKTTDSPEATAALNAAVKTVKDECDLILGIAAIEFKGDKAMEKQIERIKKLRYQNGTGKEDEDDNGSGGTAAGTTTTTPPST